MKGPQRSKELDEGPKEQKLNHRNPSSSKRNDSLEWLSQEKWNLSFLEIMLCKLNQIWGKMVSYWRKFLMFLPPCLCSSLVLILPTFVSLLMRQSFQTIIPDNHSIWMRKGSYGWAFALLVIDLILSIFVGPFMH